MPDAIKFFAAESPHELRTLRHRLAKRRGDLIEQIGTGVAADWADYRHRCGVVAGMSEAMALLDAANERGE